MFDLKTVNRFLPGRYRDRIDEAVETLSLLREIRDPRVLLSLGPSGVRGLVWKRGKQGVPSKVQASHSATLERVDNEKLFYLESRGLPPQEGLELLVEGFFWDALQKCPDLAYSEHLFNHILKCLSK